MPWLGGVNERERQLLRQRFIHSQFTIIIHHKQFPVGIIQLEEAFEAALQGLGPLIRGDDNAKLYSPSASVYRLR